MSETLTLPVLPLDDEVVLPGMVVPIELSDPEVRGAVEAARNSRGLGRGPGIRSEESARILLVPRIGDRGLAGVGTLAVIEQVGRMPGGTPGAVLRGVSRVRIGSGTTGPGAALWVEGTEIPETGQGARADELAKEYKSLVIATLQQRGAWQVVDSIKQLDDPSAIADRAGYASYLTAEQKLQLLETADLVERLELAVRWTREHLAELDVAESIRKDVTEGMEKQQREFLLRQQLAAVRKELNELSGDGKGTEEDDYRARVEAANLPENVHEAAMREVDKLERTSEQSPEVGWIRTWLDTILDIPWNERTEDAYDIAGARRDPRRGPHRARRREGPDHRVPGGAQAAPATVASASSAGVVPARCWRSSDRPASARRRSASRSRGPWTASSSALPSAACGTRRRSAATGAPTSARCPAGSSVPSARRAR